jgi:hypothetical protein
MSGQGIAHTHDRRVCWICGGQGIVAGAVSLRVLDQTLTRLGWRYLNEPGGRMVCPECRWRRHQRDILIGEEWKA